MIELKYPEYFINIKTYDFRQLWFILYGNLKS